jgi:hypothetical protein
MLRLRARRALTRLVDRSAAVSAAIVLRLRRLEDFAKTYLPQVSVAVNARLLFGPTQAALAGVATVGLLAGPGVTVAPARVTDQMRTEVAAVSGDGATLASSAMELQRAGDAADKRRASGTAPLIDDLGHKAQTERDYWFEVPGASTAGRVSLETLARIVLPENPSEMAGDKPSCSVTTSKHSASVECLHQGSLMYGVRVRNQNETVLERIH